MQVAEKIRELSPTKPGTIAARWELSTTGKKRTEHRKKQLRNNGRRVTTAPPLGMTIDDASVRAYSAVLAWKKGPLGKGGRGRLFPKKLILKNMKVALTRSCPRVPASTRESVAQSMPRRTSAGT